MTHFIKALIVVSAFLGMTNLALAEPAKKTVCEITESVATLVMEARQLGASLSEMLKATDHPDWAVAIIIEAYEEPRWSTTKMQARAIVDFANEVMLACVKQGLDKMGRDAFRAAVLAKAK